MEISRPNAQPISEEELAHLAKLKATVEKALENGEFSTAQISQIKSLIWEDGKITADELRTIRETIKEVMGDTQPGLEWMRGY
ncbi:MAG: hypothetical protein AAFV85_28165 [Cyanobacteria bacterium J06634_6]